MTIRNRFTNLATRVRRVEAKRNVQRQNFASSNFCGCYQKAISNVIDAVYDGEAPRRAPEPVSSPQGDWCSKCRLPIPRQLIDRTEATINAIFGESSADDIPLLG